VSRAEKKAARQAKLAREAKRREEEASLVHRDIAAFDKDPRPGAVLINAAGQVMARRVPMPRRSERPVEIRPGGALEMMGMGRAAEPVWGEGWREGVA
jgi:hypothetical protein